MKPKIVVVMTHYNREALMDETISSICRTSYDNFEIVVVDDFSRNMPESNNARIIRLNPPKTWTNPEPAYNTGIYFAIQEYEPDIIILQNAECFHAGDILSHVAENLTDENYLSFACYSLAVNENPHTIKNLNERGARFDGDSAWYNHSAFRMVAYDFCSAITVKNIKLLNGYDERFSDGCGYGDNFLLHRIELLGLNVHIVDEPFVFHQNHYNPLSTNVPDDKEKRVELNRNRFECLKNTGFRAKHIFTPNIDEL